MTADKGNPVPQTPGRFGMFIVLAAAVAFGAIYAFQGGGKQEQEASGGTVKQAEAPAAAEKAATRGLSPALATGAMKRLTIHPQPKPLPKIVALDRKGRPHDLSEWKGKVLLVNFWASWCPPCRKEMPEIIALQNAYEGKNFRVIAISEDYKGYDWAFSALKMMGGQGLTLLWDKGNTSLKAIGIQGLPVTLLVDRQGREVARLIGPANWNSEEAHAIIDRLLAEK